MRQEAFASLARPDERNRFVGLFSSLTPEWATPQALYDELNEEFGFTLDPCATPENAKCARFFTRVENGLAQSWAGETVWLNPPYGDELPRWIRKAYGESLNGATVVALIPSRTDTRWWHEHVMKATDIRFIRGRLAFNDGPTKAPFPSCVVVWRAA